MNNKRNGWFLASGIISIIDAVLMGLLSFILLIAAVTYSSIELPPDATIEGTMPPDEFFVAFFVSLIVLFLLFMTAAIVCSVIYLKNSTRSFDEMHKHSGSVITAIVLSFLCCGWLVGLFAILGYTMRPANETVTETKVPQEAPVQPEAPKRIEPSIDSDAAIAKLEQLKKLYDQNLISEEEFNEKKKIYIDKI